MAEVNRQPVVRMLPIWRSRLPVKPGGGLLLLPLVDVLFLLLIFLMIGSSLVFHHGISVNPPEASAPSVSGIDKLVITLTKDKQLYFNDTLIRGWDELENELAKIVNNGPRKPTIILRADKEASYDEVARILAITSSHGMSLFMATRSPGAAE